MAKRQLDLFSPDAGPWVEALWRRCSPQKREEVIAVLAEMARKNIGSSEEVMSPEVRDER